LKIPLQLIAGDKFRISIVDFAVIVQSQNWGGGGGRGAMRGDEASQKFGGNWHREGILSRSKNKRYFLVMIQKFSLVRDRLCTPY
jgi:hypothetical protein